MLKFFKSQKFQDAKYSALQTVLAHQNVVDVGMSVAKSISNFAQSKSPLSFIEGGVAAFNAGLKIISGESSDFFSIKNGWSCLAHKTYQQTIYDILCSALEVYPSKQLKFAYESEKSLVYTLPIGVVARTMRGIFYRSGEVNENDILQFIIKEKIKFAGSKIFAITEQSFIGSSGYATTKFDLIAEEDVALPSQTANDMTAYINRYIDAGVPRSIIFNGPPGTGKTSLAYKVFQNLGLNVLKFKYNKNTNTSVMGAAYILIDIFKIDLILLDDFDYFTETASMLGFLEWLHRHTKVVIAITNSLKTFPPAILRPGRFDEVKTIECLDDKVIKDILGDLYDSFAGKVDKWPVAYINELAIRARTNPDINPEEYIEELQGRVSAQLKILKGGQ